MYIYFVAYRISAIFLGAGDPLGAPSAHATFVHTDPLRAVPEPAKVSSPLAVANATTCLDEGEDDVVPKKVVVGTRGLNDVFVVDNSGRLHVAESVLLGDEHDVFVSEVSHAVDAPVTAAPAFDAIEEWLAENDDPDAPVQDEPPVKIHAKRSSSGSDPSKVKRARYTITSSLPKDLRVSKARMSSSKNSLAKVDRQPRRGK
ncbi:hypothetical protein V6N12_065156 [Hibiscus sabdariffa]|uniref:Uncharacterized protein n=1 Tax=Hibiscus sabdariffa TaxID=183260 RepID=A0ABR2G809_9ROSI